MKITKIATVLFIAVMASTMVFALAGENCCLKMKDVKVAVANIENGVTFTYTAANPDAKKAIEDKLLKCSDTAACDMCGMRGIKREVKITEGGAVMTLTAKNAKKIQKLQETAKAETSGKGCAGAAEKGCSKEQQKKCAHGGQ